MNGRVKCPSLNMTLKIRRLVYLYLACRFGSWLDGQTYHLGSLVPAWARPARSIIIFSLRDPKLCCFQFWALARAIERSCALKHLAWPPKVSLDCHMDRLRAQQFARLCTKHRERTKRHSLERPTRGRIHKTSVCFVCRSSVPPSTNALLHYIVSPLLNPYVRSS
jgi:hypothetical protein